MSELVSRAELVAAAAHGAVGQLRKYTNEPYIVHPRAVVQLARTSTRVSEEMLAAAWLHDVVEDTAITSEQIHDWFGSHVGAMVDDLTNVGPEAGNRSTRYFINAERLMLASPMVQTIKVCDLIDNTSTIVEHDPGFAWTYLREKLTLLRDYLGRADQALWQQAHDQCLLAMKGLPKK